MNPCDILRKLGLVRCDCELHDHEVQYPEGLLERKMPDGRRWEVCTAVARALDRRLHEPSWRGTFLAAVECHKCGDYEPSNYAALLAGWQRQEHDGEHVWSCPACFVFFAA